MTYKPATSTTRDDQEQTIVADPALHDMILYMLEVLDRIEQHLQVVSNETNGNGGS